MFRSSDTVVTCNLSTQTQLDSIKCSLLHCNPKIIASPNRYTVYTTVWVGTGLGSEPFFVWQRIFVIVGEDIGQRNNDFEVVWLNICLPNLFLQPRGEVCRQHGTSRRVIAELQYTIPQVASQPSQTGSYIIGGCTTSVRPQIYPMPLGSVERREWRRSKLVRVMHSSWFVAIKLSSLLRFCDSTKGPLLRGVLANITITPYQYGEIYV